MGEKAKEKTTQSRDQDPSVAGRAGQTLFQKGGIPKAPLNMTTWKILFLWI